MHATSAHISLLRLSNAPEPDDLYCNVNLVMITIVPFLIGAYSQCLVLVLFTFHTKQLHRTIIALCSMIAFAPLQVAQSHAAFVHVALVTRADEAPVRQRSSSSSADSGQSWLSPLHELEGVNVVVGSKPVCQRRGHDHH